MPKLTAIIRPNAGLERERLTSLINSMADGVVAVNKHIRVVVYNGAALNILDINTLSEGTELTKILHLLNKHNQPVNVTEYIRQVTTAQTTRDLRLKYADGSTINLYMSVAPVHLGYGKNADQGYVLLLRDITREKSLEEERDEFISVISHELRTPIAIAEGNISNAQFMADKSGDLIKVKQALKQAEEQITFLSGLINDLATLSRAERGKLSVEIEPINVYDLVHELAESYKPDADKKDLTLTVQADRSLELLKSSRLYVREILQNFMTNAIKYTEKGGVTLSARPQGRGVVFAVHDTGIGIGKGDQGKVFDKFFRSEDFRTRRNSGTGLGLYVSIKLARLIHAEINLDSELNKGSTFSVFVPDLE